MVVSLALRRLSSRLRRPISGHLCRSLSTAASHPPWAMFDRVSLAFQSEQPLEMTATFELAQPPGYSFLLMPAHFIVTAEEPGPCRYSGVEQILCGALSSSSADGLLVLAYADVRASPPILARLLGRQVPGAAQTTGGEPACGRVSDFTYLVCNPLSGQVFRVPDSGGLTDILGEPRMGILTQADRGHGPPDRFALAQLRMGNSMVRFLSDTREWDLVKGAPFQHPLARRMWTTDQEVLAFGGRLWWVDVSCGAMSADPFSDRAETRFVELPKGSLLPEPHDESRKELVKHRRMGVSEGRLRYAEVSQGEPFILSSFVLDDEGGGWTLEHRVALSRVLADEGQPWLPLQGVNTPKISVLDPLNASIMNLNVGDHIVAVDMHIGKVIGSSPLNGRGEIPGFVPCVLPSWLGSSRIPSTGKDISENQSFADIIDHSENCRRDEAYQYKATI